MGESNIVSEKSKKHRFKFLTFLSALVNIILSAGLVYLVVTVVTKIYSEWMVNDDVTVVVGFILMPIIFLFVGLCALGVIFYVICGILMLISSFKDDRAYSKWKGLVITTVVFDFILAVISLLLMFMLMETDSWMLFMIAAIGTLLSAILKIIDMSVHKKRLKKTAEEKKQQAKVENGEIPNVNPNVDFSALNKTEEPISNIEDIENKIIKK